MTKSDFPEIEKRLGYQFVDRSLLTRALTHSSLSGANKAVYDLERLEFLGDRVLGLLTAEELWRRYPNFEEGDLAPRLNELVRKETCAKAALFFEVDKYMQLSEWEEQSGGRQKKAILGDVMEALLGAIYIDGGLEASRGVYDLYWTPNLEDLSKSHKDPKTTLQEWTQNKKLGIPHYEVVQSEGPAHAPAFKIEVQVKGFDPAMGEGKSKRAAQMDAAKVFLIREKLWEENE